MNPRALTVSGQLCGRTVGKAHARPGDTDKNERDYRALEWAVESGAGTAKSGLTCRARADSAALMDTRPTSERADPGLVGRLGGPGGL
jgi:hypothetical protein